MFKWLKELFSTEWIVIEPEEQKEEKLKEVEAYMAGCRFGVFLKWKKLRKDAYAPVKFHEGDACFDLAPCEIGSNGDLRLCKFGIAVEIPKGYVGLIFPRSSVYKTCCRLSNCTGIIDNNYRGELKAVFDVLDTDYPTYNVGERCCQLMLVKLPEVSLFEVEELSPSDRGEGGFGSTGRR